MSILYQQREGSGGTNRAITAVAGNQITVGTGLGATVNVGDIAEINGSSTNDGPYTIIELVTGGTNPTVFKVRPTPNATVSGNVRKLNKITVVQASTAVTSVVIDTIDTSLAYVQATGATFRTGAIPVQINDRLCIEGSAVAANNGAWIVHAIISDTVVCVRTPDGGTGMTVQVAASGNLSVRQGRIRIAILNENPQIAAKSGTPSWEFDAATQTITRGSGSWITDGFITGHRVTITGTTSNNGITAQITSVSALVLTIANGAIVDESISSGSGADFKVFGLTWSYVLANGTPQTAPANNFASGAMRDFLWISGINSANEIRTLVRLLGISAITLDQSTVGTPSSWYQLNEVVVTDTAGNNATCTLLNSGTWASNPMSVFLGFRPGNRYSCGKGSTLIGFNWFNVVNVQTYLYGSYVDCTGTAEFTSLGSAESIASLVRSRFNLGTGLVESCIGYGETGGGGGGLSFNGAGDQANILCANQVGIASINAAGTVAGLLVSDKVAGWSFNVAGVFTIQNPRIDLELNGLISNVSGSNEKTYLYSPRFVSNDAGGFPVAVGNQDIVVTVNEIRESDGDENVAMAADYSNADGRLTGGGAYLRRETQNSAEAVEYYSHRIIIEGGGFRRVNKVIQMTGPYLGDWTLDRLNPDYEGEHSE